MMAVLVGCAAADGILRAEERSRATDLMRSSRWALGLGVEATEAATTRALNLIADHGLPALLAACAEAIPAELRGTAFALAVDVALADGRLGTRESTLIDQLQSAFRIDGALARKIIDVLLIKNRAAGRPDL
jgi:tellurite resistance protein